MKVYIVTSGSYSDYHIDAVCLDKEQAEKLAEAITDEGFDEGHAEEWDTDNFKIIDDGMNLYHIQIMLSPDRNEIRDVYIYKARKVASYVTSRCVFIDNSGARIPNLELTVRTKDKENAKKIAYDRFAEWKAQKEGLV